MRKTTLRFNSQVWLYPGAQAAWHFISLPKKEAAEVAALQADVLRRTQGKRRGWGAVKVVATIGKTSWQTSIFPDKKSGTYLLPIKASVRKAEGLFEKDTVLVHLGLSI